MKGPKTVMLLVVNRDACPVRRMPDPEGGWGPQVPCCEHPEREARGGDPWCPEIGPHRTDRSLDASYGTGPFPRTCPLQPFEVLKPLGS
jgi:hypothetical protein